MPNPTEISLLNYNLEAKACNELLTAMLNHSDFDYVTVDELRRYSELCKRGFLHVVLGDRIDKKYTWHRVFFFWWASGGISQQALWAITERSEKS